MHIELFEAIFKQDALCTAVGWSGEAVDPKTYCKYIHPFICFIIHLKIDVVRVFIDSYSPHSITFTSNQIWQRICLISTFYRSLHSNVNVYNDCLMSIDGLDFWIPEKRPKLCCFKFKKYALKYKVAVCIIAGGIFGLAVLTHKGFGMILILAIHLWQLGLSLFNMLR